MSSWILYFIILLLAFFMWIFVIFSLWKEYRYATLLFDLLPLYPVISIGAFIAFVPTIIIWLKEPLLYSFPLAFAFIITLVLTLMSLRWIRGYRLLAYKKMLAVLKDEKFLVRVVSDYFNKEVDPEKINVFIRHDVDLSLRKLKKMLKCEEEAEILSTSFFRFHSNKYSIQKARNYIEEISQKGFEIGFHYEVLSAANNDHEKAIELFQAELGTLREIAPVEIVSAHGDKFNNRKIWKDIDKEQLKINSAYDMKSDLYLSDAGGFDIINKFGHNLFEELAKVKKGDVVQILIHADWWF